MFLNILLPIQTYRLSSRSVRQTTYSKWRHVKFSLFKSTPIMLAHLMSAFPVFPISANGTTVHPLHRLETWGAVSFFIPLHHIPQWHSTLSSIPPPPPKKGIKVKESGLGHCCFILYPHHPLGWSLGFCHFNVLKISPICPPLWSLHFHFSHTTIISGMNCCGKLLSGLHTSSSTLIIPPMSIKPLPQ